MKKSDVIEGYVIDIKPKYIEITTHGKKVNLDDYKVKE